MGKREKVSIGFISLGCAKNLVDSQIIAGFVKADEWELAPAPELADIIIINTCAFIEDAREEAAEVIVSACEHKKQGGCKAVVVAGCMVARYREKMIGAFPDVDAFLGIDDLESVTKIIRKLAAGKTCGMIARKGEPHRLYNPIYPTLLFTGGPFSYLKVSDGCNHRCAYCAIPIIRGKLRSREMPDLIKETKSMISAGVREINIIAQDVFRYGCDLSKTGRTKLPALLKKIDKLEGDFWLRLLYGYPSELTDEILEMVADGKHSCHYLDLPIQHSHPDILRAMNRAAAIDSVAHLTERIRGVIPDITLRTTCLVGFPGETDEHFRHLVEYVKASEYDHLGVFVYSPEEGTAAYDRDCPPLEVAEERAEILMNVQKKISRKRQKARIGKRENALLLVQKGKYWIGRIQGQAPDVDGVTKITGVSDQASTGDFIPVTITGARGYDLIAQA